MTCSLPALLPAETMLQLSGCELASFFQALEPCAQLPGQTLRFAGHLFWLLRLQALLPTEQNSHHKHHHRHCALPR